MAISCFSDAKQLPIIMYTYFMSALEIDYPSKITDGKLSSNHQVSNPPNEKNFENHITGQNNTEDSSLESLQPCQMRSRNSAKVGNKMILSKEALHHTNTKCKGKSKIMANQVTALERASSFKSCNPFFLVVMHPSYIRNGPLVSPIIRFGY
ncbi:hypothetical protein VNO78_16060 [Psophocarpus tetragonolobus]|uniref:Uncharacterized protein n=1 Tax=Psophocarpus tetragonolobus TaxID=3891 RepID=A0AAN9XKG0_PSOTE